MGPNGSGKTTLAYALMGHPAYVVTGGEVTWQGRDVLKLSPDKRARLGMFLAFQYPTAIPGLSVASFIRSALNAKLQGVDKTGDVDPTDPMKGGVSMRDFRNKMREKMALLKMDESFATRYVNEGFSGGEKKRLEMLQMAVLEPQIAILDETDSGLDIDALRIVAEGVNAMLNPELGVLLITHYQRLLNYITPDVVHVLAQGRIVKSGGKDLALRLEDEGYGPILREAGLETNVSDEALLVPKGPIGDDADAAPASTSRRRSPARAGASAMAIETEPNRRQCARAPRRRVPPLDPVALRRDFPILAQEIHGHPLIYLDSASSSQKPQVVIDAIDTYYREYNANVHRGIYTIGEKSTAEYEKARAKVARFINAPDAHEVIFTRNATEAINLVAYSWGRKNISRGDAIVLTEMEHHANLVPWQLLVQEQDGDLEFIPITDDGHPPARRLRGPAEAPPEARRVHPRLEHARHDQPGPRDGRDGPRRRRARPRRRRPGRAARAGRRPGARRRLLRVQRPQDAGPDGLRRAVGPARAARGDAAVPRRRRDDPRGPSPPLGLERHPVEVRGRDAGRRRRDRARRRGGVPDGHRDGRGPRARARARRLRARDAARARCPAIELYGPLDPDAPRRRHPVQPARASTRTTSPRCSTGSGSRSGPATTARCRSTSGSTWRRRPGRASASTRPATTSTALADGLLEVQKLFGD